jgi:hypothetical protein
LQELGCLVAIAGTAAPLVGGLKQAGGLPQGVVGVPASRKPPRNLFVGAGGRSERSDRWRALRTERRLAGHGALVTHLGRLRGGRSRRHDEPDHDRNRGKGQTPNEAHQQAIGHGYLNWASTSSK